jgi:hypothetical protein
MEWGECSGRGEVTTVILEAFRQGSLLWSHSYGDGSFTLG